MMRLPSWLIWGPEDNWKQNRVDDRRFSYSLAGSSTPMYGDSGEAQRWAWLWVVPFKFYCAVLSTSVITDPFTQSFNHVDIVDSLDQLLFILSLSSPLLPAPAL
jgi:hypothetical protein